MKTDIYIQIPQCTDLFQPEVTIKDFATVYCRDASLKEKVEQLSFYHFSTTQEDKCIASSVAVVSKIQDAFPDTTIYNIGETDFVLLYNQTTNSERVREKIYTVLLCLVSFFGGGYAIMSYNTDVGALELFSNLSMLLLGNAKSGTLLLTITYSIGLFIGLIAFFNHLGAKKINSDPTPLEIQMRSYEKDISTTIIQDANRRNQSIVPKE